MSLKSEARIRAARYTALLDMGEELSLPKKFVNPLILHRAAINFTSIKTVLKNYLGDLYQEFEENPENFSVENLLPKTNVDLDYFNFLKTVSGDIIDRYASTYVEISANYYKLNTKFAPDYETNMLIQTMLIRNPGLTEVYVDKCGISREALRNFFIENNEDSTNMGLLPDAEVVSTGLKKRKGNWFIADAEKILTALDVAYLEEARNLVLESRKMSLFSLKENKEAAKGGYVGSVADLVLSSSTAVAIMPGAVDAAFVGFPEIFSANANTMAAAALALLNVVRSVKRSITVNKKLSSERENRANLTSSILKSSILKSKVTRTIPENKF